MPPRAARSRFLPDGRFVCYLKDVKQEIGSLFKSPIDGGGEVKLADSVYGIDFAPGKRGIYFISTLNWFSSSSSIDFLPDGATQAKRLWVLEQPAA